MTAFDQFVEKVVLHNKIATTELLQKAKDYQTSHPELELADLLIRAGVLKAEQVVAIRRKFAATNTAPITVPVPPPAAVEVPVSEPTAVAVEPERPLSAQNSSDPTSFTTLEDYLSYARKFGASDLHINAGSPPLVRKDGQLQVLDRPPFTAQEAESLLFSVLDGQQRETLRTQFALDTCCDVPGLGRYRSCFACQSRGWDGSFRIVDQQVPSFEQLNLPDNLKSLTEYHQGLVLVAGPSGCGKTTTMAAMIQLINQNREEHIITMEDPIEYVFFPEKSHISQRQVGAHTESFSAALRAALREDPDVIMIGELRDRETATLAISAAETGHLVFASLHTTGAAQTVSRILDFFPADQQGQVRSMISESIRGIICQRLIPQAEGQGRVLALEVMFNNTAIGNLIREDRMFQLPTMMQINRDKGMCQLEDSLQQLVQEGAIEGTEAWFEAANKSPFKQYQPEMMEGGE
ncbi:MAG: PilT/PilU family type 4a pilus ATPase [Desulfuromonas sp.]|nr:PilT/PilU family type 4a pilus ATPase [Desulfuromonas sp.]